MSDRELVAEVVREAERRDGEGFSTWELDFLSNMDMITSQGSILSPMQRRKLEEIKEERL